MNVPGKALWGFAISVFIQLSATGLFYYITASLGNYSPGELSFTNMATVFPLGMLTAALPIAPGGLGVGHVAFEQLFNMIGITGGANTFNLFVLSLLALNLIGVVPYLRMKKRHQEIPNPADVAFPSESLTRSP